jgi:hypothetical protein
MNDVSACAPLASSVIFCMLASVTLVCPGVRSQLNATVASAGS